MNYTTSDHTFAICAHKVNPMLEELVISIMTQTVKTNVIMSTSTPNKHIQDIAEKYRIPLFVNTKETDMIGSWMFAVNCTKTPLITICHQDDTYESTYIEKVLQAINCAKNPIITFTDYFELRNNIKVFDNNILKIKRLMLSPLKIFKNSVFIRRRILSLGNPICCPAVTYQRDILLEHPFPTDFIGNHDWAQWEALSKLNGSFVYVNEPLMCHRIHQGSTTSAMIGDNSRQREDFEIFCRFWSKPIAKIITKGYSQSEKYNSLE